MLLSVCVCPLQAAHAEMVAAVLALRLKHDGVALIGVAVREQVSLWSGSLGNLRFGPGSMPPCGAAWTQTT